MSQDEFGELGVGYEAPQQADAGRKEAANSLAQRVSRPFLRVAIVVLAQDLAVFELKAGFDLVADPDFSLGGGLEVWKV